MSEQRLIDANALKKALCKVCGMRHYCKSHDDDCWAKRRIDEQPTVDAVPVVRCRECKYAHLTYDGDIKYCDLLAAKDEYGDCDPCFYRSGDWFCADGERRSEGEQ